MLSGKGGNALSVPVGGGGSPSGTLNAFCCVLGNGQSGARSRCPMSLDQYSLSSIMAFSVYLFVGDWVCSLEVGPS